ncbi:MAG: cobaltochelatase subunit CobN [Promethearchaeota archaeon]
MIDKNIPKITLVSASVFVRWLTEAISEIYREIGKVFEFKIYFLNDVDSGKINKEDFIKDIYDSDILLIDIRGNCLTAEIIVETYDKMENEDPELFNSKTIISLVGGNTELRKLTKMGPFLAKKIPSPEQKGYGTDEIPDLTNAVRFGKKMTSFIKTLGRFFPIKALRHARYWGLMMDYWVYGLGGLAENHKNMILFLLKHYLGYKDLEVQNPIKIPSFGIYDINLNRYFDDLKDYTKVKPLDDQKQTIGLFFYGGLYFEQSLPIVEEFIKNLTDFNIIPVFSDVLTNLEAHKKFFFQDGKNIVSGVINLQYFQLNGGPFGGDGSITLELFKDMNVPHFNPIIQFDMPCEEYFESKEGIIPINQIIAIVMPELDGRFEMNTVGCMKNLGYSEKIHSEVLEVTPISENVSLVCNRIRKWLNLRKKLNSEKKIALIIYNYPPGEDKIGNAAYLDVCESVRNLINEFIKEGYNVKNIPEDKNLADIFIEGGSINKAKHISTSNFNGVFLNKEDYLKLISDLPEELKQEIYEFWDTPVGKIMIKNSNIKLPVIKLNNLYLCLQPSRSTISGDSNEYHNKNLPPHHQYLAFYRYLDKILDVDAIINIGTHGTEEFLPGKECAGGISDFPINLMGDIPNLYYYHITNTSESAIAKRRANALIINHAGPSFKNSDLYEEIEYLEILIKEYLSEFNFNVQTTSDGVKSERIQDLEKEIEDLAKKLEFRYTSISELEDLLYRYKTSIIPMGLHILGKKYNLEEKRDIIKMILLHSVEKSDEIDIFLSKLLVENGKEEPEKLDIIIDQILNQIYSTLNTNDIDIKTISKSFELNTQIDDQEIKYFVKWIIDLVYRMDNSMEMENLIHALEGSYIEPGLGGDPIRSPYIFPTGRNSYGFDPRLIPNSTAYKRGSIIAENLINKYYKEKGRYPETVSVVLWAFETMKTGGETIGQIFNYLGVRIVKSKSIWTTEFEIIPLEEMNHPRINVLTTICGIFRDTFPYLLDLINHAIEKVAELDESCDKNFIRKTYIELKNKRVEEPIARIFGPPLGKYNTNLTDIISAGKWGEEKELVDDYINNMCFAYMKNQKVIKSPKTFTQTVSEVNLMSQIRDSSEYHITDLDHYYEFTGGLARTHEQLSGKKANVYIADSSRKNIQVDRLENSIKEGTITRNLNPQWIKSMLKHKYHGGQKVAERFENVLGLAATTHDVDNWIWEKSYQQYVENDEIRKALIENNRFAMMDIIKNMLQADDRGYWDATEEQSDKLKKLYLDLENWVETIYQ